MNWVFFATIYGTFFFPISALGKPLPAVLLLSLFLIQIVLMLAYFRGPGRSAAPRLSLDRNGFGREILTAGALWLGLLLLALLLRLVLGGLVPSPAAAPSPRNEGLLAILLLSILSAYREELFFRGFLLSWSAREGWPQGPVLIVQAILFASGHAYLGVLGWGFSLLAGLVLGWTYLRTGSVHGIAWGHGLYNLTVQGAG